MMWGMLTACAWFVMAFGIGVLVLFVHDLLTPKYNTMKELQAGNVAAGLAAAGKMVGLGVVQAAAITHGAGLWQALAWGAFGGVLMILGYLLFEAATFRMDVEQQLADGNRAVGILSFGISVGTGLVIAACIAAPASMGIGLVALGQ